MRVKIITECVVGLAPIFFLFPKPFNFIIRWMRFRWFGTWVIDRKIFFGEITHFCIKGLKFSFE